MEFLLLVALIGTVVFAARDFLKWYESTPKGRRQAVSLFWRDMHQVVDEGVSEGLGVNAIRSQCNEMFRLQEYDDKTAGMIRPYISKRVNAAYRESIRR